MATRIALVLQLVLMAGLIAVSVTFPTAVTRLFESQPGWYLDAKLLHVLSATLFFGNVVLGTIWEARSLKSRRLEVIQHTYRTVAFLDAFFTAPLILTAVTSGVMLGTLLGGVFSMGWLSLAFVLFVASGVVWIVLDIPTQGRVRLLVAARPTSDGEAPPELVRALKQRLALNLVTIVPLLVVFFLMVKKPDLPRFRFARTEPPTTSAP